jgi:hypothetical protein
MTLVLEASRKDSRRSERKAEPQVLPLTVVRAPGGQLTVCKDGVTTPVRVCRCFPWSEPARFVSLRDDKENELALIERLGDLDPQSRASVEVALAEAGFVLEIVRIESAEEVFEIRAWKVQTKQGSRTFQTALDEWPREVSSGGYLVRDISGDLFYIARPEEMDDKSQKILWALVD